MADFHQNGVISTLHNFSHRTVDDIENELRTFSKDAPIELILPSLYSEVVPSGHVAVPLTNLSDPN